MIRKYSKYIFIAIITCFIFVLIPANRAEASCSVASAIFEIPGAQPDSTGKMPSSWYKDASQPVVKLKTRFLGCANAIVNISLTDESDFDIGEVDDMELEIPSSSDYTSTISLLAGETYCWNNLGIVSDCEYNIRVETPSGEYFSKGKVDGTLKYSCEGACDKDWLFGTTPTSDTSNGTSCIIKSASFSPNGEQNNDWYDDENKPPVTVEIQTKGCDNQKIDFDIFGQNALFGFDLYVPELEKTFVIDPSNNDPTTGNNIFKIKLKAGETECKNSSDSDCQYYMVIDPPGWNNEFSTENKNSGELLYECDTVCDEDWGFVGTEGLNAGGDVVTGQDNNDSGSGAYDEIYQKGIYKLLAPLQIGNQKLNTFDVSKKGAFSDYLTLIFRFLIGIAGVLSVIMIIIGGIQYMSTDAISGKEEGRERVTQAILGLLLALGAWLILNTINPTLLSLKIGFSDTPASITNNQDSGGYYLNTPGNTDIGNLDSYKDAETGSNGQKCTHTNQITVPHFKMSSENFTSSHPQIQQNLTALKIAFQELSNKVEEETGFLIELNVTSSYRSRLYQKHFYEIFKLNQELSNINNNTCDKLKAWVSAEINKHGIQGAVANPDTGCGGDHTIGKAMDLKQDGKSISAMGNGNDCSKNSSGKWTGGSLCIISKIAEEIAATKTNGEPYLKWGAIGNDKVHFKLINAPVNCPSETPAIP